MNRFVLHAVVDVDSLERLEPQGDSLGVVETVLVEELEDANVLPTGGDGRQDNGGNEYNKREEDVRKGDTDEVVGDGLVDVVSSDEVNVLEPENEKLMDAGCAEGE